MFEILLSSMWFGSSKAIKEFQTIKFRIKHKMFENCNACMYAALLFVRKAVILNDADQQTGAEAIELSLLPLKFKIQTGQTS